MAVTASVYNGGLKAILEGVDFENDDIKVALLDTGYTVDVDGDVYFSDVSGDEISGAGYTAGGQSLEGLSGGITAYQDNVNNRADVENVDTTMWDALTATNLRYAVLYKNTGTASTSPLLFAINFGTTYNLTAQDFSIVWAMSLLFILKKT